MTRIPFDPDAIRALAAVLNETGLTEIEFERGAAGANFELP